MSWTLSGRVYDVDNAIGLAGVVIGANYSPSGLTQITVTDDGGYYSFFVSSNGDTLSLTAYLGTYRTGFTFGTASLIGPGPYIHNFELGNSPHRQRHPRDNTFHTGQDYDYALEYRDLTEGYTSVQNLIYGLWQALRDRNSPSFTISALISLPTIDLANWAWATRIHDISASYALLMDAAYGNGVWVAVGWGNTMFTAPVGEPINPIVTWTPRNPGFGFNDVSGVAFDGTTWVIVGDSKISTATDPTSTWTSRATPAVYFDGVVFASSTWVAFGATGLYTATTPTGTWTSRSVAAFNNHEIVKIAFGNSLWTGITVNGEIATATSATSTWTSRTGPGMGTGAGIAYGNGWWVATGYRVVTASPLVLAGGPWITRDPITGPWTELNLGYRTTGDVEFVDETFVVVAEDPSPSFAFHIITAQFPTDAWVARDPTPNMSGSNRRHLGNDGVRTWLLVGDDGDSQHPTLDFAWSTSPTKFHADAVFFKVLSGSLTVDAWLAGRFSINATFLKTVTGSKTLDAVLKAALAGSVSADAALRRSQSSSVTADSVLNKIIEASLTVDAYLLGTGEVISSFTVDAVIFGVISASFTINAYITDGFQADAFQMDSFQ